MAIQKLIIIERNSRYHITKVQSVIGLIIFSFIILFTFHDNLPFRWSFKDLYRITLDQLTFGTKSKTNLLLLYEEQLSRIEKVSFRPTFHNRHLTLKLNLTSMGTQLSNYFKSDSKTQTHHLKISCLKSMKNLDDFHSICDIYLTFGKILNIEEIHLILLSQNMTCSLSLKNLSNMISIDIHRTFSVDDIFRFTHQWSHLNTMQSIIWPKWPLTTTCVDLFLSNLIKTRNRFSKLHFNSLQCSLQSVLIHSTSRELYIEEQTALSYWLDLQYKSSIYHRFLNQTNKNIRRFAPFELAKNPEVCSPQFNNWISNYQQWHENISYSISNRSMTFEQQRDHIIELDVRFLIYKKHISGIADRITHLISTYLVALLTKRLFIFDKNWPDFLDIMQSSLNYEQDFVIPWFSQLDLLNKNLSINDRNYLTFKSQWFSFDRFLKDYNYDKDFPQRILMFGAHTGGVIQTIDSSTSIYKKFLTVDLKMNTNNIFGCLYNSLFTYRLSELIERVSLTSSHEKLGHSPQQILQTLLSPKFFPIGIQIRAGDKIMMNRYIQQSNLTVLDETNIKKFQYFFTCSQGITHRNEMLFNKTGQIPITYLLSDSLEVRRAALRRWEFPLKCFQSFKKECQWNNSDLYILANPNAVLHISYTNNPTLAFKLGMFDVFLFSLCEQHIISTESGFGRFAAFASLQQRNIYSFLLDEQHSCQDEGISLAISGHHWSGL